MIYREVGFIPEQPGLDDILDMADLVCHPPEIGRIISDKRRANAFFSERNVPMPKLFETSTATEAVFSNDNNDSGAAVYTVSTGADLSPDRYNTSLIDTRAEYEGEQYYISVRLMCVGATITHTVMRARPVSEGSPCVHSKNTPVDSHLLNDFFRRFVIQNMDRLQNIADGVVAAIGPGFYSHDILLDTNSGEIFMAETGFKFNNLAYRNLMDEVIDDLEFLAGFKEVEDIARRSVGPFLQMIDTAQKRNRRLDADPRR